VEVKIVKDKLVIIIPMEGARPSASGKTMVVATSAGNQRSGCFVKDGGGKERELFIGVNAYYKP
jgi:hypothetical protein